MSVVSAWMLTAHKSPWGGSRDNANGIGEYRRDQMTEQQACGCCSGRGWRYNKRPHGANGPKVKEPCNNCKGYGKIPTRRLRCGDIEMNGLTLAHRWRETPHGQICVNCGERIVDKSPNDKLTDSHPGR